jgi:Tfp pilus assembly protein PilX
MRPFTWALSSYMLVYWLAYLVVIGGVIVALWRGALAQERIARHLEGIERALSQRALP